MSIAEVIAAQKPATLWKNGAFTEDGFAAVADDAAIDGKGGAIVSLTRWRRDREALLRQNAPIGLAIQPGEKWDDVAADLPRFAVVAVAIPKYADGRAFSIGRLLRQRDGFAGELRAVGAYIIDWVPMLQRVGFDAFDVRDPILRRQLEEGEWPEVPAYLQPVNDAAEVPAGTRPWARRPAVKDGA